jgi:hypothetical protein
MARVSGPLFVGQESAPERLDDRGQTDMRGLVTA